MKIILILLLLPLMAFSQKPKGYGFVGGSANFGTETEPVTPGGRVTVGIMPAKNVGLGVELQFIVDAPKCILVDFRFVSERIGIGSVTAGVKAGSSLSGSGVKGGFAFGAETGYIFGKNKKGLYLTGQYLSIRHINKFSGKGIIDNILSLGVGAKF